MTMTGSYDYGRRGLYRSRNGIIFGVCKGIADYLDISAGWFRVIVVLAFIFTGFFPTALVYVIAALMMKKEPAVYYEDY